MYSSQTLNAGTIATDLTGVTQLCMGCHDGTINLDAYGGAAGGTTIASINAAADLGTDLSGDHPINFDYSDVAGEDSDIIANGGTTNLPLFGDSMECATCHDAHDDTNASFLRMDNSNSGLCLNCHSK